MFTIVNELRDVYGDYNTSPYIERTCLKLFDTRKEAFEYAYTSAVDEIECLSNGYDEYVSFTIPLDIEYKNREIVKVEYHNHKDNITEIVTKRIILEIKK